MINKKAIAPLISTIVLILFAAGLGIIVMNWGTAASYAIETKAECSEASINIIEIDNNKDCCFKTNNLYFTVENNGEVSLDGVRVSFIGDSIYQTDVYEKYFVGDMKKVKVEYEGIGRLLKVKIAPIVGGLVCVKQGTSIENIKEC